MSRPILLSAGGTGGHLFPAQSLAGELRSRGWPVELATDHRATRYGKDFPADAIHILPSGSPSSRNPLKVAGALVKLGWGFLKAIVLLSRVKPRAVVGFGGYPTVPPLLAARLLGIPSILHEQNAVMGRANSFLSRLATRIATSFKVTRAPEWVNAKAVYCGNPVRRAVHAAATLPPPPSGTDQPARLVVFGGSQGARFLSDSIPAAVGLLSQSLCDRLTIVQQCRPEDLARVTEAYRAIGVNVELAPFFDDLPARIASSHLVIGRAGASTIGELALIGRPAILIPLPGAIDQDQRANAAIMAEVGGAIVLDQSDADPPTLAETLDTLFADPEGLKRMAGHARAAGRQDAVAALADLVEEVAGSVL